MSFLYADYFGFAVFFFVPPMFSLLLVFNARCWSLLSFLLTNAFFFVCFRLHGCLLLYFVGYGVFRCEVRNVCLLFACGIWTGAV